MVSRIPRWKTGRVGENALKIDCAGSLWVCNGVNDRNYIEIFEARYGALSEKSWKDRCEVGEKVGDFRFGNMNFQKNGSLFYVDCVKVCDTSDLVED
jgi:hypothetical protein